MNQFGSDRQSVHLVIKLLLLGHCQTVLGLSIPGRAANRKICEVMIKSPGGLLIFNCLPAPRMQMLK